MTKSVTGEQFVECVPDRPREVELDARERSQGRPDGLDEFGLALVRPPISERLQRHLDFRVVDGMRVAVRPGTTDAGDGHRNGSGLRMRIRCKMTLFDRGMPCR